MHTATADPEPATRPKPPPRRISVLGATGSVGTNTLDLVARNRERYDVVALTAHRNVATLARLAIAHRAEIAVIADQRHYGELQAALAGHGIEAAAGPEALVEAGGRPADWIMAAIIGAAGLAPTLAAVRQGTTVALANKECLVSAGELFMAEVAGAATRLLPVDSEHSAAFQAIAGSLPEAIERVVLTASGGPFRDWSKAKIAAATPEQALCHPNWEMGPKITIDCATMMNKGFELIEGYHLFPVEPHQLDVVVHPQSIVHCLVEYRDGSVLAQLANPDMRVPIAYALAWPTRMATPVERLDLTRIGRLDFEPPDVERFPALQLARDALHSGGSAGTVLNAANEVAVEAFLSGGLGFADISALASETLEREPGASGTGRIETLESVLEIDAAARRLARSLLGRFGVAGLATG